jgi:Mg2+/Co2+ transporter CorC
MDIEWINDTASTVDYSEQAVAEYEQGQGDRIEEYTQRFEREFAVSEGEDIGGLIVYSDSCVYDYENFCGWVR